MIIAASPRRQGSALPRDRSLEISHSFLKVRFVALGAALAVFVAILFVPKVLGDGDIYMHIAAGRWMLENRAVLRIDPFSFTFAGHPWLTHEWLAEVAMALAYIGGGWSAFLLMFATVCAVAVGLFTFYMSRWLNGLALAIVVLLAISCMSGTFLVRPHLRVWPLLVVWIGELVVAAEKGRRPPLWLLPVMVLWANLHASFMFGLAFIPVMAVEDALVHRTPRAAARNWGLFAALSLVAALITPHGFDGLLFPFKLMGMPELYMIEEWQPLRLQILQPAVLVLGFVMFAFLWRGIRIGPVRLLVFLGLVYLALAHERDLMLLAMVAPLVIAQPVAAAIGAAPSTGQRAGYRPQLAFALAFVVLAVVRLAVPVERGDGRVTPASALAHVPASVARLPVFNDYSFGGYLIFKDVRPFIDGRAELYRGAFINTYVRMLRGDDKTLPAELAKYRIRWTILAPGDLAVAAMDRMKGWHRLYTDKWAVVHVKDSTP